MNGTLRSSYVQTAMAARSIMLLRKLCLRLLVNLKVLIAVQPWHCRVIVYEREERTEHWATYYTYASHTGGNAPLEYDVRASVQKQQG